MGIALVLPELVFGQGTLAKLDSILADLGVRRAMLISDAGLAAAGIVQTVRAAAPAIIEAFVDVRENPDALAVDAAAAVFLAARCDGLVALGGGSVIDAAKILAAQVTGDRRAAELIGHPERIASVVPLVALPTTLGTGSEASPVAALHLDVDSAAIGTRSRLLVPTVALCDPDLAQSLPTRLVAATAVDALSHCIEGFLADPPHPVIDALALDGMARVAADTEAAMSGDSRARASLMAAAFAGGVAIHKGLGPAHAVALACGARHVHHGTLIGVALPGAIRLVAPHAADKMKRITAALGLRADDDVADALAALISRLGQPSTLAGAGYIAEAPELLASEMAASHFNRTGPYAPSLGEYRALLDGISTDN